LPAHAGERAITHIFLGTADRFHAAHRFYEKYGFAEIAKAALPASFPIMAVDTKFHALRLPGPITDSQTCRAQ
jgi:predicted N-acetyltransferase YhbS